MKKSIGLLIILLIVAVGLLPFIDGYLFKSIYLEKVAYYREQMREDKNMQLEVVSYDIGWLQSKATLTVTKSLSSGSSGFHIQPIVMRITSTIHHGPLIYINSELRLASAYVKTVVDLPDILKVFIPQNIDGFLQITSDVSLSGNRWDSHYVIPAITSSAQGGWDGLSGNIVVDSIDGKPMKIQNKTTFGKLFIPAVIPIVPEIKSEPITSDAELTRKYENMWIGNSNLKMAGMYAKWQDGKMFSINNLTINSIYSANNNLYSYNTDFAINNMQFPASSPITSVSDFTASIVIKNLDINGLQNFKEYSNAMTPADDDAHRRALLFKLLSPTSGMDVKTKMNTDQGAVSADLTISLRALPKTSDDIENNLNVNFQTRIAQAVFDKILISHLARQDYRDNNSMPANTTMSPATITPEQMTALTQEAQTITNQLIAWGYIQRDNTDYVISFTRNGLVNTLNSKTISEDELKMIEPNINQLIDKSTSPATKK